MPPRHPSIAHALGSCRRRLGALRQLAGAGPGERDGPRVHVACSGGPDSVALLGLLCLLAPRERLRLSVGHVDHGLRPASADEAALVQQQAQARGLPFSIDRLSLAPGPGLPARARQARRAALREQARRHGAAFVALGHTATDQAETMLLHLARGAGLPGLAAMAEHEPWDDGELDAPAGPPGGLPGGGWLRPLLALTREQTRALAQRLALPFVDDPTNLDRSHPRVRMRLELLPALRELNPRVEEALARTAEHARRADEALEQWAAAELRARRCPPAPVRSTADPIPADAPAHAAEPEPVGPADPPAVTSPPRWSTEGMAALPVAVRMRIVRGVCRAAGAPEDALPARTLASVDDALLRPGPRRAWDLHPFLRLHLAHGELWAEPGPHPGPDPRPDRSPEAAHRAANH